MQSNKTSSALSLPKNQPRYNPSPNRHFVFLFPLIINYDIRTPCRRGNQGVTRHLPIALLDLVSGWTSRTMRQGYSMSHTPPHRMTTITVAKKGFSTPTSALPMFTFASSLLVVVMTLNHFDIFAYQ